MNNESATMDSTNYVDNAKKRVMCSLHVHLNNNDERLLSIGSLSKVQCNGSEDFVTSL